MNIAEKTLFIILINLASVTFVLYGFEFLFSPYVDLPVNGKFEGDRYTWGHLVKNNKYGFRERNFKNPKPSDVYRVMVIGDSLTWGAGLAVAERYTAIVEKFLNKAFNDRRFEVLNFGVSGGPTTTERDVLRKYVRAVDPDLIVVGFCFNDPQQKDQNYSVEREKLRNSISGRTIDGMSRFMRYMGLSYVSELLNNVFYKLAEMLGLIPTWQSALQHTYEPLSGEWQEFIQALRDIKSISGELNLPSPLFLILNQGTFTDKPTDYNDPDDNLKRYLQWYHQAEKAAENIGFIAYNHEYEIAHQLNNESLAINILDGHPSENLNRIYGEKLYQKIAEIITQRQFDNDEKYNRTN